MRLVLVALRYEVRLSYMALDFTADFKKHVPRIPKWMATWGWAGLVVFALTFESAGEYLISLVLFFAAWASLYSSVHHWAGIADSPSLTSFLRKSGKFIAFILLITSSVWVTIRKGTHPWSNLSEPVALLIAARKIQPPLPFIPTPENWAAKQQFATTVPSSVAIQFFYPKS
jgi:hypothetical protein